MDSERRERNLRIVKHDLIEYVQPPRDLAYHRTLQRLERVRVLAWAIVKAMLPIVAGIFVVALLIVFFVALAFFGGAPQ